MYTYAENDSTTRTKPRRHDDVVEQPGVVQSRWADQVERIGRNGEWNFELADCVPDLITVLPCWQEGGLVLHVWNDRAHTPYGASAHSVGDVYIEVAGEHYWALIDGERVWVRPDGNCFFNAIWKALQASGNVDAIKRIFRGNVPANEREASNYFRREIRDYLRKHPELEAILLGDDGSPAGRRESLSARDAAIGNDMGATPEPFRALQRLQGEIDETDADASATADWLAQPGEQREKPSFEPQQAGSNEASHPQKRVRRLTPFANQYRSASGTDQETPENGFFRTAASIAKRAGEQIGRPAAAASSVYRARQEIFRALGADDVLKALSPILIPDGFEDAPREADWLPQTAQDAGLAESDWDEIAALFRTPTKVKWDMPLVEYRPIPHACRTEFQRVRFSAGSQISEWLSYSALLTFGYWALAKVSPMLSGVVAAGTTVWNLWNALRQRDVVGGLIQVLLALPYQLLSQQSLLFAIAEETKRYIDDVLDGVFPECLSAQWNYIYIALGVVALISYYAYFVKRRAVNPLVSSVLGQRAYPPNGFIFENDIHPPETPLGRNLAGMIGKLRRAVQGYTILQTIVNAVPGTSVNAVSSTGESAHDPQSKASEPRRGQILRHTGKAVFAFCPKVAHVANGQDGVKSPDLRTIMENVIPSLGEEDVSATAAMVCSILSGGAETTGSTTPPRQSLLEEQTNATLQSAQLAAETVQSAVPEACARSPGAKSGGYVSIPMAAATATAATVAGHAAFSTAGEEVVAQTVENTALLVDGEAGAVGVTAGVQSLVRKSPLVGGVVGGVGALSAGAYGLYRLVTWLQQADGDEPAPQGLAHGENSTSAVSEGVDATTVSENGSTVMHGRSDGLSSSTHSTRRQIETEAEIISESTMTPGSTQSFATSTGAVGEPWPSGIELDEMVDDFIVTLTEEDDDFLAMRQSVIPSDGGMPPDLIDLALYRFEQESMTDRSGRDRRSVSADTGTTIAPAATNELSSWIRNNWPERDAFTPPPDDPMQMVTPGVYQSKNGNAYMFIGGAYWKFVSTTRRKGYLENEKTKKQLIIVRRMPNFLWGFTSSGRKKLRLGPIPAADIPKLASVSPELASWVARRWGATGADVKQGGGVRISDGIYENKKRDLFLKVNGAFWKFRFMADRSHAELSNRNGETVSLQFAEGGWNRASVARTEGVITEANGPDRKVKVTTYSEDMSVVMREGKAGVLTLDNSEYILKNFDENFERRKFEEIRLENEPLIELGADAKEKESFIEAVFSQDAEIKNYISNPYENSRNAVQRLWDLFFGSEASGIVKGFDEKGLSTEDARKVEGLKNLVRDQDFSIEVRAINYWESDRTSAINKAHFAFVLNFPTVKFILDPTAPALIENIGGPLVKAEQQWLRACQEALANSTATVKYKDFSSYENALEFSPAYPVDARTYVEGSFLVREAPWYREDGAPSAEAAPSTASPDSAPGEDMPASGDDQATRALLRTLLATAPAKIDESRPVRDPACEAGLIHFFSFENGLADVIAPNVSLQPFDSTSTTTETSVADGFGGKAMQVSSLNRGGDGLNGMKLADDVSSRPQFSIGFWFKSDGVQHHAPVLCNKDWGAALNPGFVIDQQNNGCLKFNVADGSKRADAFIKFTRNAWVYVAMTFDTAASTATAYVGDPIHGAQTATLNLDGMDMTGIAGAHGTIALNEDVLGNYYSRYGHTYGSMTFDDLAMWDHVLTVQELDALAMSGLTGGLIHFFPFENGPADLVAPNVSLQPFDGSSTTHAAFIADHFSGEAMQVLSLNWAAGALNGMKLADDVSSHPQFSIGFWFKSDGVQNHAPVLGNKDWSAGVNPGFVIDQQKEGWLKFNVGDGKNRVDKFIPFSRDAWVYIAMTFDTTASTATAYVCETSGTCRSARLDLRGMDMSRITGTHSTIGLNEDARGDYHSRRNDGYGTMAFNDLAMWNWVLTETEVRSLGGWGHSLFELLGD